MRSLRFYIAIITCCIITCLHAQAQQSFVRDLWLNDANVPVKVNDLLADAKGYTWLATDMGLYRFNGRSFVYMPDALHKPITAVGNCNGSIYAGFADGTLCRLENDRLQPVQLKGAKPASAITSLTCTGGRVLWICTEEEGVIAVINNIGVACNTTNGLSDDYCYNVSPMPGRRMIVGTDRGINELAFNKGRITTKRFTMAQGLPDNIIRVLKPMQGSTLYWVGMQQGGVALFCNQSRNIYTYSADSAWGWGQVNDIWPMQPGRAWVATDDGYILDVRLGANDSMVVKPIHLPGKKVKKLMLSRSGVLYAATNMGITLVTAEYMQYMPLPPQNYKLQNLLAMTCDKQNNLWYADGRKLYRQKIGAPIKPQLVVEMTENITALYADKDNRMWIGSFSKGLWYRNEQGALINVKGIAPLENENILDISGTGDKLWVAGLNGVQELFYPGTFTQKIDLLKAHNKHTGMGSDYVYQLYTDRSNNIWMATDGAGIRKYSYGKYETWDSSSGMNASVAYTITQDADGDIWAGTLNDGLYRLHDKQWTLMQGQGLQDNHISTLAANATGQVVVVNNKGIDVWYPLSNQFRNYPNRSFGIDSTSTLLKLSATDKQGNVYIPFQSGFIIFKNIREPYDIRPLVNILGVSVFFKPVPFGTQAFNYDENHIGFRYEGINFANPDRVHYRYKLEGYSSGWLVTNDESIVFPQLPDGSYKLIVQASLNRSFSDHGEAVYSFTVRRPFWKQPLFLILTAIGIVCLSYLYIRQREANIRKLSFLQRERMRFEYEHLKSQVNPHFLFNSLNTLTSLIEDDTTAAMDYTTRLSDLYRHMLSYRDKDLIPLADEWEILENYMYIQKSRFGNSLRLHTSVPDEMMHTRKVIPLALQLLVENAIKHNTVSKAHPLDITIEATFEYITVRNNLQPKISKEKGAGLGLANIRKRYSLMSKRKVFYGIKDNEYVVILPLL